MIAGNKLLRMTRILLQSIKRKSEANSEAVLRTIVFDRAPDLASTLGISDLWSLRVLAFELCSIAMPAH
jgi:hypothetical protein